MISYRAQGLLASLCLHACLAGGLLYAAGNTDPSEPVLLQVLLVGPKAGATAAAGSNAGERTVEKRVENTAENRAASSSAPEPTPTSVPVRPAEPAGTYTAKPAARVEKPKPLLRKPVATPKTPAVPSATATPDTAPAAMPASAAGGPVPGPSAGPSADKNAGAGFSNVYGPQETDQAPSVLRGVRPEYPAEAKRKRLEGRVVVRLVVSAEGRPVECTVHSARPEGYFEAAALEAAQKTRFKPGKKDGRPVNTRILLPFDFRLR